MEDGDFEFEFDGTIEVEIHPAPKDFRAEKSLRKVLKLFKAANYKRQDKIVEEDEEADEDGEQVTEDVEQAAEDDEEVEKEYGGSGDHVIITPKVPINEDQPEHDEIIETENIEDEDYNYDDDDLEEDEEIEEDDIEKVVDENDYKEDNVEYNVEVDNVDEVVVENDDKLNYVEDNVEQDDLEEDDDSEEEEVDKSEDEKTITEKCEQVVENVKEITPNKQPFEFEENSEDITDDEINSNTFISSHKTTNEKDEIDQIIDYEYDYEDDVDYDELKSTTYDVIADDTFDLELLQRAVNDIPMNQKKYKNGTKKSMTFSNERMREIGRHNQILLQKILNKQQPTINRNLQLRASSSRSLVIIIIL